MPRMASILPSPRSSLHHPTGSSFPRSGLRAWFTSGMTSMTPGAVVGVFMTQSVAELDLKDFAKAVPAVVTMLAMPLTFSIAEGIAIGFVVHVFFMLGIGRAREVKPLAWVLGLLFLAHLVTK